ncbi:putative sulfate exporter family transporter [Phreatobacter stygius]|uniref:Putative sulfate exporter family transporter n=2 Tax=Phreatobacter stygius TaxID=1940610 RepID=A0A4D7B382_9HYPH|nr:putative sulfate exporter family transporter [Phreatobacter stygius]QCI65018.1 putative sulfate exporter family transporter [Phreatobacter stygius]
MTSNTVLPGLGLSIAVAGVAAGLEQAQLWLFGRAWLEALVLAILVGMAVRTFLRLGPRHDRGVEFAAKTVLEWAVVLLGVSVSAGALSAAGPLLIAGIATVVVVAILASYGIGRALGLPHRLAVLVACGNSICGNSAIAAAAPVIGADGEDVAASIAFTAALGVVVVLCLPLLVPLLGLSPLQYGVFAGLTVYAVPQVLAATAPVGLVSVQVGTLVKLIRVLMLGPVILALALGGRDNRHQAPRRLVPWFIVGFLVLMALRSLDLVPAMVVSSLTELSTVLTIVAMAALGLGVDGRMLGAAGGRVTAAAVLSLVVLGGISLLLIRSLGIA